jgi:hypothetical protein
MSSASLPTIVRVVRQSGFHGDCAIAALAMFCGVMYEDSLLACAMVRRDVLQTGMTWPQIRAAAKRLGVKTRLIHRYDISEATGILHVSRVALGATSPGEHVALLWEGRVIEGNGELWLDASDYLRHYGYEAKGLLVARED